MLHVSFIQFHLNHLFSSGCLVLQMNCNCSYLPISERKYSWTTNLLSNMKSYKSSGLLSFHLSKTGSEFWSFLFKTNEQLNQQKYFSEYETSSVMKKEQIKAHKHVLFLFNLITERLNHCRLHLIISFQLIYFNDENMKRNTFCNF